MRWKKLEELNKSQKAAVLLNSTNLLIIAGAGSGKTKTLTHKIAYIISNLNIKPYEIVAITFTNKAAKEIKERTETLIGSKINGMYIGTFHSVALRILHNEGIRPNIYDIKDQLLLLKFLLKEMNIDAKKFTPERFLSSISHYKTKMISYENIEESSAFFTLLKNVFKRYEEELEKLSAVDFDNIILKCVKLFEDKKIRDKYSSMFKYIFIDEYQDTNYPQYVFINKLSNENNIVCAVGDEDQSIYGFRGADVKNIMKFDTDYKNCKIIKLEKNYRSAKNILNIANKVIQKNTYRKDKFLYTDIEGGNVIIKGFATDADEAYFIANTILDLLNKKNNIAVLYRTNFQSYVIESALMKLSIKYKVWGSIRFFDRKEIKNILSYLKLALNPDDNVAFIRAINSHPRGIGEKLLDKVRKYASEFNTTYFSTSDKLVVNKNLPKKQEKSLSEFLSLIKKLNYLYNTKKSDRNFIDMVFDLSGYVKYLEQMKEFGKIENVMDLRHIINNSNLYEFFESISLLDYSDILDVSENVVNLMTIHASKGLEFDTVFIPGLEEGLFPNAKLKLNDLDMEEERRLFYVAITRAKSNLFVSFANYRKKNNKYETTKPSRFLSELDIFNVDYKRGMRVKHMMFGEGVVLGMDTADDGVIVTINFYKYGIKKLLSKDVNLHILSMEADYG